MPARHRSTPSPASPTAATPTPSSRRATPSSAPDASMQPLGTERPDNLELPLSAARDTKSSVYAMNDQTFHTPSFGDEEFDIPSIHGQHANGQSAHIQYSQMHHSAPQDNEDLFNFVPDDPPINRRSASKTLGLDAAACRRRSRTEQLVLSYIKKPVKRGTKLIRIEVYDAENFPNSMCECEADVCVQYVVKGIMFDEIYSSTMGVIGKIQDHLDNRI